MGCLKPVRESRGFPTLDAPVERNGIVRAGAMALKGIPTQPADNWLAIGACRGCPVAMKGIFHDLFG
jgi:hypothetical protein